MKEHRHLGAYGLLIENNTILLIKKNGGPYDGLLDLPGGTIEHGERPIDALKREFKEEVGINVLECELFDTDSVNVDWHYNNELINVHHVGIFYKILKYDGNINNSILITEQNDDSLGAEFYDINNLKKEQLSKISILELKKIESKNG